MTLHRCMEYSLDSAYFLFFSYWWADFVDESIPSESVIINCEPTRFLSGTIFLPIKNDKDNLFACYSVLPSNWLYLLSWCQRRYQYVCKTLIHSSHSLFASAYRLTPINWLTREWLFNVMILSRFVWISERDLDLQMDPLKIYAITIIINRLIQIKLYDKSRTQCCQRVPPRSGRKETNNFINIALV